MRNITFILFIIFLGGSLVFLANKGRTFQKSPTKLKVAVTIFPLYDLTKNIAGDKVEVIQILPPGASPHTFEVTPSTLKKLEGTGIVFQIGMGLDTWVEDITSSLDSIKKIPVSEGIKLKKEVTGNDPGGVNPHYWLSLTNGKIIAKNITEALKTEDPENANFYQSQFNTYSQDLAKENQYLLAKMGNLSNRNLVTFHDAWLYFADDFGLVVVATFEPFPGKEPTPKYLAELQTVIKKYNIKTIFSEPQLSDEIIKSFTKDLGVNLAVLDPLGGVAGRDSFINLMRYNVEVIITQSMVTHN